MCPRQQSEGDVTSDIGDSNNRAGPPKMGPGPYTVIINEKPRSRGVHVCGVNDAFRRNTSKEPLEELRLVRVTFQG